MQRNEEAINSYNHVIQIDPNHIDALFNKAKCLINLERFQESVECNQKVIELAPDCIDAYYNKGVS